MDPSSKVDMNEPQVTRCMTHTEPTYFNFIQKVKTCTENYSPGGIKSVRREVQLSRPPKKFHPQLAEMFKDAAKKLSESAGDNSGKGKDE